jgi:hypothetical protein
MVSLATFTSESGLEPKGIETDPKMVTPTLAALELRLIV